MEDLRAEITDSVILLDSLKDKIKETGNPVFMLAAKVEKRELLGLYVRKLNKRKPTVDNAPTLDTVGI